MTDRWSARQGSVLVVGVGASQGLGAAIARRFAAGGYPVAVAGRSADKVEAVAAELRASGAKALAAVGDASSAEDAKMFVAAAENLAPLAVAVHNAGSNIPGPFLEIGADRFERHWREHAFGGFHVAQAALPALLKRGGGSLIFTGASASMRGREGFAAFTAAKGGLRNFAQSAAKELGPQGIHVGHVVVDGGIDGEKLHNLAPQYAAQRAQEGRLIELEGIADAYVYLHGQKPAAWSFEIDLRTHAEPW